jgi:hypothetical protein
VTSRIQSDHQMQNRLARLPMMDAGARGFHTDLYMTWAEDAVGIFVGRLVKNSGQLWLVSTFLL